MNRSTILYILLAVLALVLVAPPAIADDYDEDDSDAPAITAEADAEARATARSSSRSRSTSRSSAEGGEAYAGALGVGYVGTDVTVEGDVFEAADVKGAANELARQAATAADSRSSSSGNNAACGDATGLSAQTGIVGGSLSTVPEACRAFRAMASEQQLRKNGFTRRATAVKVVYWIGFPFRTVLHIATLGVLN